MIQTALKCREYTVAWEIFNLIKLKSMATHPDEMTYNLMIHACAETGETERAINLWKEMTLRRGIEPGEETYHTIIHACALRKDYYHEAWKYATDMVKRGMRLNVYSVNILIQACGRVGELTRARLLVRHMINSGLETLQPNHITFQNMLRAYATYHVPGNRVKNKLLGSGTRDEINPLDAVFVQPTTNLQKHEPGEENLSMQIMEDIPFLPKAVLKTRRDVLDEAALLVNWLRDHFPEMVDTQMMNSYLDVCAAQGSIGDLKWSYFNDFENPPTHEELREQQRAEREAAEREQSEWPSQQYPHPEEDAPLYSDASEGAESQPANWGAVPEQAEADEAEPAAIEAEAEVSESETTDTGIPHSAVENDVAPSVASEPCESRSMATESEPESESEVATTSPASELSEFDPSTSELPDPTSFDDLPDPSTTNFDPSESESESHLPHESDQSDSNPTSQQTLLPPLSEETPADDEDVPIDGFSDLPKLHRNLYTFDSCLSACVTFRNLRFARKVWADRMKYLETPQYLSTRESDRRALDFAAERKLIDILALSDKTIEARERMLTLQNEAGVEWQWDELRTLYVKAVQLEDAVTVRAVRQATERDKEGRRKKWLDVTEEEAETPDYRY